MSYTTYTQTGPFNPGGAPGISAAFLNAVEAFLAAGWFDSAITSNHSGVLTTLGHVVNGSIQNNPTSVVLNGGTSGTATLYQDFTGSVKRVLVVESGFRTAGAAQTIAIPTPFTTKFYVRTGFIDRVQFLSSSVAQTVAVFTAFNSGSLGTTANVTTVFGFAIGECLHPCDTISWPASGASANNGMILMEGI